MKVFTTYTAKNLAKTTATLLIIGLVSLLSLILFSSTSHASGFKFTPEVCKEYGLGKSWYCKEDKKLDTNDLTEITP